MTENETEQPEEVQEEIPTIGNFEMPTFSMDDVFDSSLLDF